VQELKPPPPPPEESPFVWKQECPREYELKIKLNLEGPVEFIQQTTCCVLRFEWLQHSLRLSYETREIEELEASLQEGKKAVNKLLKTMNDCLSYVRIFHNQRRK